MTEGRAQASAYFVGPCARSSRLSGVKTLPNFGILPSIVANQSADFKLERFPMKIKRYLLVFFLLGIWGLLPVSKSYGQTPPPPLPSDIVFGANAGNSLEYLQAGPFVLTLLDSHSMEFIELYRSDHDIPVPLMEKTIRTRIRWQVHTAA
jgi:hypothetical protein